MAPTARTYALGDLCANGFSRFVVIGFLTSAFCVSSARGWADPIVVTSGFLAQHTSDPLVFRFVAPGLDVNGFSNNLFDLPGEFGVFRTCCRSGEPIDMSARVSRQLDDGVNVMFGGISYAQVWWGGELRFDAPSVMMPPTVSPTTLVQVPFALSGQLIAFATSTLSGTPLFATSLAGAGVASLGFLLPTGTPDLVGIGDLDYEISVSAPAPTPEPASLILLGSGLAVAGIRRWRRRRPNV
jgi:PEP-CTERM motif-containing protein